MLLFDAAILGTGFGVLVTDRGFGFIDVDKKFPITPPFTLVDFEIDFFRPPKLATELDNGDLILNIGDFADTAALVSALDLVISVDTSVCHLAGALGKPCWVVIPYTADWRWLTQKCYLVLSAWGPPCLLWLRMIGGKFDCLARLPVQWLEAATY